MQRGALLTKLTLLGASVLLFAWSLTFDAYYIAGQREGAPAFLSLLTGWLGIFQGGFSWLANLPLLAAWVCLLLKSDVVAAGSAIVAALIASTFTLQSSIAVDEAGNMGPISGAGLGYWMWLTSIVLALAAACWPPMRPIAQLRETRREPAR